MCLHTYVQLCILINHTEVNCFYIRRSECRSLSNLSNDPCGSAEGQGQGLSEFNIDLVHIIRQMSSYSSSDHHHHHHSHHLPYTVPSKDGYPMNEDGIPWTGVHPGVTGGEDEDLPGPPKLAPPVGVWSAGHKYRTYSPADAMTLRPLLTEGGDCAHLPIVSGADPGWLDGEPKHVVGSDRSRVAGVLQRKGRHLKSMTTILCLALGLAIALAGVLLGVALLTWTPTRSEGKNRSNPV